MTGHAFEDSRITAIGLLMEVYAGLTDRLATHLEQYGLSLAEFEVLMRLARSPEHQLRMTDLATQTSLSTSGVTRLVDRMERDKLLCRRACPSDRRSSYAAVTEAGMARLTESLPDHLALIDQWFTGQLDPAVLDGLLTALRTVRDAVHPGAVAGGATAPSSRQVADLTDRGEPCPSCHQ